MQSRDQSPANTVESGKFDTSLSECLSTLSWLCELTTPTSDVIDLNELLPGELVVDPSLVTVSTVIGQGKSSYTQGHRCKLCYLYHMLCCLQESLE